MRYGGTHLLVWMKTLIGIEEPTFSLGYDNG